MAYVFPLKWVDLAFTERIPVITECGAMTGLEDKEGEVRVYLRLSWWDCF